MTSAATRPVLAPATAAGAIGEVLRRSEIRSVFQPVVALATGRVAGYEALARGPRGELESPDRLFASARAAGLVAELDQACRLAAFRGARHLRLLAPLTLFVNVEPDVLDDAPLDELVELVSRAPGTLRVVLEITERALTARPAELLRTVRRVRELGWGIALDDVGADPASLAFMPLLRPDVVKLDLRLVQARPSPSGAQIMSAVNAYAEDSGALLLAEGIETEAHLLTARAFGATLGQGWLFGRPTATPAPIDPEAVHALRLPGPPSGPAEGLQDSPFECLPIGTVLSQTTKPLLTELSKHLEREAIQLGDTCVVVSTFQHRRYLTAATATRYTRLVERTGFACVLGQGIPAEPLPGLRGAAMSADDPVAAEWDIVVLGPHYSAALMARRRTGCGMEGDDDEYEYTLTYRRNTVIRAARSLLDRLAPAGSVRPTAPTAGPRRVPAMPRAVDDALVRRALADARSGVTIADMTRPDQPLVYVNAAFEELAGLPVAQLLGRNCRFLQGGRTDPAVVARMRTAISEGRESREILQNVRGPEQRPWWNELFMSPVADADGHIVAYVGVQNDVTDRVEAERALRQETELARSYLTRLERLASTDPLTGLNNRRGFETLMELALHEAVRHGRAAALLFLDLDRFKIINDTLGHAVGDELLQVTAQRLAAQVREPFLVGRLGGDEFVVALTDLDPDDAAEVARTFADSLRRIVAEPVRLAGQQVAVGTSIGISLYPDDAVDFGRLLHLADLRMYAAKHPTPA